jgi:hypothetical protein
MIRRFFQSLEQGVEGSVGNLVRLVENVDLEAVASISITSTALPARISVHDSQIPQGSATGLSDERQFKAAARIRATVVFPIPRWPLKM